MQNDGTNRDLENGLLLRKPKWNWRSYLTAEELAVLVAADKAKSIWLKLNKERAGITNRAIQRAKYAALSRS